MTALLDAAQSALPPGAVAAWRDPRKLHPLGVEEAAHIAKAVPARRAEFSAGRDAARACLEALNQPSADIRAVNRAPIWPSEVVGSITHSRSECLAVMALRRDLAGLGIDIEPDTPLPVELHGTVLREDESALRDDAKAVFSAKEAVYKMLSARLPHMLEFHDLHLARDGAKTWTATLVSGAGPWPSGATFKVNSLHAADHFLSLCWLKEGEIP